jgi:hypothetical protein
MSETDQLSHALAAYSALLKSEFNHILGSPPAGQCLSPTQMAFWRDTRRFPTEGYCQHVLRLGESGSIRLRMEFWRGTTTLVTLSPPVRRPLSS